MSIDIYVHTQEQISFTIHTTSAQTSLPATHGMLKLMWAGIGVRVWDRDWHTGHWYTGIPNTLATCLALICVFPKSFKISSESCFLHTQWENKVTTTFKCIIRRTNVRSCCRVSNIFHDVCQVEWRLLQERIQCASYNRLDDVLH